MKFLIFFLIFIGSTAPTFAESCHERFIELLINGNKQMGPVRIHLTQEIIGGKTSLNYHHNDGDGNGMTEMIEPAGDPWSLFLGDKMYKSDDKGETWNYMYSYDAKKSLADSVSALTKDASKATGILCGKEDYNGASHEIVEGSYTSTMLSGGEVYDKYWVNPQTGLIVKSYSHIKSNGFESKTTQLIEQVPKFTVPKVD